MQYNFKKKTEYNNKIEKIIKIKSKKLILKMYSLYENYIVVFYKNK